MVNLTRVRSIKEVNMSSTKSFAYAVTHYCAADAYLETLIHEADADMAEVIAKVSKLTRKAIFDDLRKREQENNVPQRYPEYETMDGYGMLLGIMEKLCEVKPRK